MSAVFDLFVTMAGTGLFCAFVVCVIRGIISSVRNDDLPDD